MLLIAMDNLIPYTLDKNPSLYTLDKDPDFTEVSSLDKDYQYHSVIDDCWKKIDCGIYLRLKTGYMYKNGYIRLSLRNNAINLKEISKFIIYCIGRNHLINIKLLINIILMKLYGYKLEIIDTKQFLEHNEVNNNQRYQFENENRYYLDIPLFAEFYGFDKLVTTTFEIRKDTSIHTIIQEETMVKFEQVIKCDTNNEFKSSLNSRFNNFGKSFFISTSNVLFLDKRHNKCKFLFFVLEKQLDLTPHIEKITFETSKIRDQRYTKVNIDTDYMVQYEFDDIIIYGVSTNPYCDMHQWSNVVANNDTYFTSSYVQCIYITFMHNENKVIHGQVLFSINIGAK
jgi:hypothetical protein